MNVRKNVLTIQLALVTAMNGLIYDRFSAEDDPGIGDGTTDGKLRTNAAIDYRIDGAPYTKASTDDLWDLSAEVDTVADTYRAYWLYLDAAGAASFVAGSDVSSAADALATLPALDTAKSIIGVFVAGPATDFNGAAGLAAQGTIYDRVPAGVPGMSETPTPIVLVAP